MSYIDLQRDDYAPDEDGTCLTCGGRGGSIERQDPVGDGGGFETFVNPCPSCVGDRMCPRCAWNITGDYIADYICTNPDCIWTGDDIGTTGSMDSDDYGGYPLGMPDDLPF